MLLYNKKAVISLLLAAGLIICGIPFPGAVNEVSASQLQPSEIVNETVEEQLEVSAPTPVLASASTPTRLEALTSLAETALRYGRNIEGSKYPQLFVDGIDPTTKEATIWNKFTNDKYYVSNLYGQTNFLKMLVGLTEMTGDNRYKDAAYDQIQVRYNTPDSSTQVHDGLVDTNGLFYAGGHSVTDIMHGKQGYLYHETKDYQLPVELYYAVDPEGYEKYVTAYWNTHVYDASQLIMNRHGYYNDPLKNGDFWSSAYTNPSAWVESDTCPFICTANDMIELAYYQYIQSGEEKYRIWADRLLDKYIGITDTTTGLTGPVYGIMVRDNGPTDSYRDRWLYNFIGADYVDDLGNDYSMLTKWDSQIVGETQKLDRNTVQDTCGYGPQIYIDLYEKLGDSDSVSKEKMYDFVKGNMLGFVRYIYDANNHWFKTPISTNGTDFNDGTGRALVAPRAGYYLNEGDSFPANEMVVPLVLKSLIDSVNMMKPEDAAEAEELWAAARSWAKKEGLGDIGTAMGENVKVNLNTGNRDPYYVMAVISLYKYTGNEQYYNLAVRMADNIMASWYNPSTGLFTAYPNSPYVKYDTVYMYAVFAVEAMTQGMLDKITLDMGHNGLDYLHDGMGQVYDTEVFYTRAKIKAQAVNAEKQSYSLVYDNIPNHVINDIAFHENKRAIRQMVAIGAMDVDASGNFNPNATVSRGELVEMVVDLFGFDNTTVADNFRFTDVTDKPYYMAVVAAENAGILDVNLGATTFSGDAIITREEASSIIVNALRVATPEKTYYVADSLYRLEDKETIAAWAKDYADIATNYRLMVDITEDTFEPKAYVTRNMVATIFQNLCRYIEIPELEKVNVSVTPYNADSQVVTYSSSNSTVVEVDEQGRLYPLRAGTAVITAKVDQVSTTTTVTVSASQEWMLKEITINGEALPGFASDVLHYDYNLLWGTTEIPAVAATAFDGAQVEIKLPKQVPGRVELNVVGSDVIYSIDLNNARVDYTVYEDFDDEVGTVVENITTEKFNWFTQGESGNYMPYWRTVSRSDVDGSPIGDNALHFPYVHELGLSAAALRLTIGDRYWYELGDASDDMVVVTELEFAVKNMAEHDGDIDICYSEPIGTGTASFARFVLSKNQLKRRVNSTEFQTGSICTLEDNRFYQLVTVLDKKNKTYSWYLDGTLMEENVPSFHDNINTYNTVYFSMYSDTENSGVEVFYDNIRVYEVQKSVFEGGQSVFPAVPTPAPTSAPTTTAAPTARPQSTAKPVLTPVPDDGFQPVLPDDDITLTPVPDTGFQPVLPPDEDVHVHTENEKGYCDTCGAIVNGKVAVAARQLILNDDIGVTFYFDFTDAVIKDNVKVKFKFGNVVKSQMAFANNADVIVKNEVETVGGDAAYGFLCGLYAYEMNKTITAEVYERDVLIGKFKYSVEQYAEKQLADENNSAETKELINAMLLYGRLSQLHFNKDVKDLVNVDETVTLKVLSDTEKSALNNSELYPARPASAVSEGIKLKGMTLVLFAETALRAGFEFEQGYSLENFKFEAYNVTNGNTPVEDGYTGIYDGVNYFDIPGIRPDKLDDLYNIVVKNHNDEELMNFNYSPFSYVRSKLNAEDATLVDVVTALYRYNEAAKAFVAAHPPTTK